MYATDPWIYSYTGRKVGPNYEVPSLTDIAVQLGRICRFAGACRIFYPVLIHSFVVSDLLPDELKAYGLLHDATEAVIGDIPRGFKTDDQIELEKVMYARIVADQGLPAISEKLYNLAIKKADDEALRAECRAIGNPELAKLFEPNKEIEELVIEYTCAYSPSSCVWADGKAVRDFVSRFERYKGYHDRKATSTGI